MTQSPNILAVGGAHIDRRGQVSGAYVPAASNPGTMREDVGGGVFNALRTAMRRGASASLLSVRGGDAAAEAVARAIAECGAADLSVTFLDRTTPSYTALLDREGELIVGFADMALYDIAFPKQIRRAKAREAVSAADAVLCDANLPVPALERLAILADGKPLFAVAISPAKVVRLSSILGRLTLLFMNHREAAALAEVAREAAMRDVVAGLQKAGLESGVVTSGDDAILGFDGKGSFAIRPPAARHVADVTGAGDALAGATVAALLRGLDLRQALREGVAAALLAVESPDAVPKFDAASFAEALALVPRAEEVA
ncbi:carbohydrate kinase [Mesorhizobium sp. Root157]|uniref:carbohydrate kinase family protein n=1 Tax=Mesorhizobium sp. Root157 TaxID=1736477 RepID=UPI0006F4118D|nr:carbohydrate kinase family protein [Mesorhizobium sp. Root157]KQZ78288.1 carbohydrate kinase [Mesorhizobium sp. Root157]